jgi:hypothetical protein
MTEPQVGERYDDCGGWCWWSAGVDERLSTRAPALEPIGAPGVCAVVASCHYPIGGALPRSWLSGNGIRERNR